MVENAILQDATTQRGLAYANTLHTEITRIVQQPAFRDQVRSEGTEVVTNTPEKFREFLKADVAKWSKILKESGAKVD